MCTVKVCTALITGNFGAHFSSSGTRTVPLFRWEDSPNLMWELIGICATRKRKKKRPGHFVPEGLDRRIPNSKDLNAVCFCERPQITTGRKKLTFQNGQKCHLGGALFGKNVSKMQKKIGCKAPERKKWPFGTPRDLVRTRFGSRGVVWTPSFRSRRGGGGSPPPKRPPHIEPSSRDAGQPTPSSHCFRC